MSSNEKVSFKQQLPLLKDSKDLFLACCDWESAIQAERENRRRIALENNIENFSDSGDEINKN